MKDFRTLKVWAKAHAVALSICRLTKTFPRGERYGLTSQMSRAAISIPTNLAEGCGADTDPEFAQFVRIALRSASEVEYQLLLAKDLGLLRTEITERATADVVEVKRMLTGLKKKLSAERSPRIAAVYANAEG